MLASLNATAAGLNYAHLTREGARRTVARFVRLLLAMGYTHIARMRDVKGRHLREYVAHRLKHGIALRTIHNEMSHLRGLLRADGATAVADAPELNDKLGIGGASRKGTNAPATDEQIEAICMRAIKSRRPGIAAMIRLDCALGLRGNEGLHAHIDTLNRWRRELEAEGIVQVVLGTKGGRTRYVEPQDRVAAMSAIEFAIQSVSPSGFLISRADGKRVAGLKSARSIWQSWAHRHGFKPHSLRYRFAEAQSSSYSDDGFEEREALARVSLDLGHGDGRGRWVKSVYLSGKDAADPSAGKIDVAISRADPCFQNSPDRQSNER